MQSAVSRATHAQLPVLPLRPPAFHPITRSLLPHGLLGLGYAQFVLSCMNAPICFFRFHSSGQRQPGQATTAEQPGPPGETRDEITTNEETDMG
jgi:hypothetical protein